MTAKRLQTSVDNSLVLLRQVQHKFGKHEAKEPLQGPSNGKMGGEKQAEEVAEANGSAKDEEEEEEEEEAKVFVFFNAKKSKIIFKKIPERPEP